MSIVAIIFSILFFIGAILLLAPRILLAPACAYIGMLCLSFATASDGYPLLPINSTILIGWLCMTLVVMVATILQPVPLRFARKGMGYMTVGAIAGMAVGLMGFTFVHSLSTLYGIMIVATAIGVFFGFLLYSKTPDGQPVGIGSGHFFKYLLAKGFPTAITIMQIGVVLVLITALYL
jgi:hypothetical protein